MLSKKLKSIITKILLSCVLVTCLISGGLRINVYSHPSQNYPTKIVSQYKQCKGRILIYHTHTIEEYQDRDKTVVDAGLELKKQLEHEGYFVDHITTNFCTDYNKAYQSSRKMLENTNLYQYDLILDIHRNAYPANKSVIINNKQIATMSFVSTKQNPNRHHMMKNIQGIKKHLNNGVYYKTIETYNKGVNYYSGDLNENILLLEIGNEKSNYNDIKNSISYLSEAIDNYIKESK